MKVLDRDIEVFIDSLNFQVNKLYTLNKYNESIVLGEESFALITRSEKVVGVIANLTQVEVVKKYSPIAQGRDTIFEPVFTKFDFILHFEDKAVKIEMPVGTLDVNRESNKVVKEVIEKLQSVKPLLYIKQN